MPHFRYKAYSANGQIQDGLVEADTEDGALFELRQRELRPFELVKSGAAVATPWWQYEVGGSRDVSAKEFNAVCRELAMLVNARVPVDQALRVVGAQTGRPRVARLAGKMQAEIVAGKPLSEAFETSTRRVSDAFLGTIRAGEASGSTGRVLEELADLQERTEALRTRITSAMTYPAILLALALATVVLISMVLIPSLAPLFEGRNVPPPFLIGLVLSVQESFRNYGLLILGGTVLGLLLLVLFFRQENTRRFLDGWLLRSSLFGSSVKALSSARIARTLGTMLRCGVPLVQALVVTRSVLGNRVMRELLDTTVEDVKAGRQVSASLAGSKAVSPVLVQLAAVGEETGNLDDMLIRAATILERETETRLERFFTLLTPVLTLLIGGAEGALILSVMDAVLSVNDIALQ